VISTIHVSAYSPVAVAKAAATIDQITGGRFGINIVVGWNKAEVELFGQALKEHDARYDVADEWLEVMEKLWTSDTRFDYRGKHYDIRGAIGNPKPARRPVIMNAGGSDRGREFAAQRSDMAFIAAVDTRPDAIRAQVEAYHKRARESGRALQVWSHAYVVQRNSVAEAQAFVDDYAGTRGDEAAADEFMAGTLGQFKAPQELLDQLRKPIMAGALGYPLLGNESDIAASLQHLSELGIDGVLLSWLDYEGGLRQFGESVMPLLESAGLRQAAG
jgi:alkanesulfonate monooxygenase SsuD/methylene tetrahydromethanopterin reductase-like flavin-dependent oxidoreductase (luciferase family)